MESWYKVTMTDADITAHRYTKLQRDFEALFMAALGPRDAAMFSNSDPVLDHQFYFSPGAVRIAKTLIEINGGVPCQSPSASEVDLLVGEADARRLLLGSQGSN